MTKNTAIGQPQNQDPHVITKLSHLKELAIGLQELLKNDVAPKILPYLTQQIESRINTLLSFHNANFENFKAELLEAEAKKNDNSASQAN